MFTAIIILSALAQGLIALIVLIKNYRSLTNILFFFLSLFLVVWSSINFVITSDPFSSNQLTLYRLLMASVVAQNTFFFLFAHAYPNQRVDVKLGHIKKYLTLSILALIATLSPILFVSVQYGDAGARPVTGPGMLIFVAHAAISVASGLRAIFSHYRKAKGVSRQQFRLIFIGSVILWGVVPLTNFVISLATQTLFFARISPIYTLAFSSIIAYAIIKHRFFDIRLIVARAVAYVLSLGTLIVAYAATVFGISEFIIKDTSSQSTQRALYIGFAVISSLTYPPMKRYFDKVSRRVFYKDGYDTQEFLDELNRVLVAQVELEPLLVSTSEVIKANLKADYCLFAIRETSYFPMRVVGQATNKIDEDAIAQIRPLMPQIRQKVVVRDYSDENKALSNLLSKYDIGAVVRLVPTLDYEVEGIGEIFLGPRRSGDPYTTQDMQLLEIMANELVIAIQNALRFEEIGKFNVTLQTKIDDATRELRRTNKKLEALDEAKDEFISMASHQLRTPLTSVKGYLSMVLEGDAGKLNDQQKKLLDQAFISSQRMVFLIADLLNVSRLKTGKFLIETKPTKLDEVVQQEVDQLKETAEGRGLKLTYRKPDAFPILMLDETKIRQVIMNFMDNAIYYTPSGGNIEVFLKNSSQAVEFTVVDNGLGVPKSEQQHLFTKFYRAVNARKARPDGTGLGLFMAKKVVVAQNGAIIFKSQEGKGSTFGFSFAKAKLKPATVTPTAKN